MSAIPGLKNKLKSVRATGKLSKAMKTVSAAKYSRLSELYKNYSDYPAEFRFLYGYSDEDGRKISDTVVIIGSARGFCGGFNNELISFITGEIKASVRPAVLISCGDELTKALTEAGHAPDLSFSFSEIPEEKECEALFEKLDSLANGRKDFPVTLVYPRYINTMTQTPVAETICLNPSSAEEGLDDYLFIPDRETVLSDITLKGLRALLFGAILETALGAQASTLMTMRSSYDAAVKFTENLEGEIHRIRQTEVTSDVLETAADHSNSEVENDG